MFPNIITKNIIHLVKLKDYFIPSKSTRERSLTHTQISSMWTLDNQLIKATNPRIRRVLELHKNID